MMNADYFTYCDELYAAWQRGELDLSDVPSGLFDLAFAPEPYIRLQEGKRPLHMLLTNPGAPMAFQHRSEAPPTYRAFAELSQSIYLSDQFAKEGGANARRRIYKSFDFALFLGCSGLVNVETIPFHSARLDKRQALKVSQTAHSIQAYQSQLQSFLVNQPVLIVAACRTDESIHAGSVAQNPWLRFQCDLASIQMDRLELKPLTRKGAKVTSALFSAGIKHVVLTMGSNNLPSLDAV